MKINMQLFKANFYLPKTTHCIGHMHGKRRFHHPFLAQWVDTLGRHGISGTEHFWVGWVGRHRWPRFLSRYFLFYPSPSHFCQVSLWSKSRYELSSPFRKNGDMFWQKILAARISFQRFYYLPSWALDIGSLSWKTEEAILYKCTHTTYLYMQTNCMYIRIHMLLTPFFLETLLPSNSVFSLGSFRWRRRSLGWCVSGRVQVAHCLAYQRLGEIS